MSSSIYAFDLSREKVRSHRPGVTDGAAGLHRTAMDGRSKTNAEPRGIPQDDADFAAAKIAIHLFNGNWNAARDLIDQAELESQSETKAAKKPFRDETTDGLEAVAVAFKEMPLGGTGMPVRTTNALEEMGIFQMSELFNHDQAWLMRIPNFGVKCCEQISDAISRTFWRPEFKLLREHIEYVWDDGPKLRRLPEAKPAA